MDQQKNCRHKQLRSTLRARIPRKMLRIFAEADNVARLSLFQGNQLHIGILVWCISTTSSGPNTSWWNPIPALLDVIEKPKNNQKFIPLENITNDGAQYYQPTVFFQLMDVNVFPSLQPPAIFLCTTVPPDLAFFAVNVFVYRDILNKCHFYH